MAEESLDLEEIDTGLDQMGGITVSKTVRGDLFWLCYVSCG